jgi:hypothetical protein
MGRFLTVKFFLDGITGIGYLPQDSFLSMAPLRDNLVWDSDRNITDIEIENMY